MLQHFLRHRQGFITYCIVKVCKGKAKEVHPILWVVTALFVLNFILLAVI